MRALKRFVTEKFGVESGKYDESPLEVIRRFLSIGQSTDLTFIDSEDIALNEHGQLKLDPSFSETEAEGVFAAGDVAYGAKLMIDAIASGKQAARKIYTYLKDFLKSRANVRRAGASIVV